MTEAHLKYALKHLKISKERFNTYNNLDPSIHGNYRELEILEEQLNVWVKFYKDNKHLSKEELNLKRIANEGCNENNKKKNERMRLGLPSEKPPNSTYK